MFENLVLANGKRKSQSATNVCPGAGHYIDIVTNHEGPPKCRPKQSTPSLKIEDRHSYTKVHEQKPIYTFVKNQKPSENLAKDQTPNTIDRSCTCYVRVNKADAATQYELSVETFVSTPNEVPRKVCDNTPQPEVLKVS